MSTTGYFASHLCNLRFWLCDIYDGLFDKITMVSQGNAMSTTGYAYALVVAFF
ncbi:hypothetical protein [Nostoc sp.]|uniref:hypothetical protein n=1 Tax=Nostoc sp. TaxID=1180 RepID=UPI002FF9784E